MDEFERRGCKPLAKNQEGYSSLLIRCGCRQHGFAAVECSDAGEATKLFGAAVSWHRTAARPLPLQFILGTTPGGEWKQALYAIQGLLPIQRNTEVLVDFRPFRLANRKDHSDPRWVAAMLDEKRRKPPSTAKEIERLAEFEEFRWYRSVTGPEWSGRVNGLEVCTMSGKGSRLTFGVGTPGQDEDHEARVAFLRLMRVDPGGFGPDYQGDCLKLAPLDAGNVERAAKLLASVRKAGIHELGDEEHRLEAKVLDRRIEVRNGAKQLLEPLEFDAPFQFPTKWWKGRGRRFVDVMARTGNTPWVVELKVERNQGTYYRDGIVQVALYRNYVKDSARLDEWFRRRRLDRSKCKAALVIPPLHGPNEKALRDDHLATAKEFDVELIELPEAAQP